MIIILPDLNTARAGQQRPESYRRRSLCGRFIVSLLAPLLLAGCVGTSAPLQERDNLSQQPDTTSSQHMDWKTLTSDLEKALKEVPGKRIDHLPEGLRVLLPAAQGFTTGKTDITPALVTTLQRIAPVFNRHEDTRLHIVAHTDSSGSEMF
ncbi:MAG: hypothetical protein LBV29_04590, partial [Azoarcus sp.]|nr:hypothetical protein [Azoarcus sp.]